MIIAVPMIIIVLAKHFTDKFQPLLANGTHLPWAADAILGTISICTLAVAPVILRYIWATEPLPAGALRERFVRTCGRIGLRYREILLWHTHGTAINAAVMGFVAPLRYILVSDALLETMDEEEIEAVFGHEAGHVRHWHLPFFRTVRDGVDVYMRRRDHSPKQDRFAARPEAGKPCAVDRAGDSAAGMAVRVRMAIATIRTSGGRLWGAVRDAGREIVRGAVPGARVESGGRAVHQRSQCVRQNATEDRGPERDTEGRTKLAARDDRVSMPVDRGSGG